MFGKKHKAEDIISAHAKQRRKYIGEGGIRFTPEEQAVLDEHVPLEDATAEESNS